MLCPICEGKTVVIDSKAEPDLVKRRRKCVDCDFRFNTEEVDADYFKMIERKHPNAELEKSVPVPCMAGDTAYMVTNTGHIRHLTVTSVDIKLRKNETDMVIWALGEIDGQPNCHIQIVPSKIGEIYFFSLDAAKQVLKEREG